MRVYVSSSGVRLDRIRSDLKGRHAAGTIDLAAERVTQIMRQRFQPDIVPALS